MIMFVLTTIMIMILCSEVNGSTLLVGNTRNNTFPVYRVDPVGKGVDTFITAENSGSVLNNPDFFKIYNNVLYISSGDTIESSSIVQFTLGGDYIDTIVTPGNGLKRPYGFDIYNNTIYVASFRSDQILTYSAIDGTYLGVFAQGNGTREGLCNGPNHISIINGKLYMTTQGSVIVKGELTYPGFPSEVVVYDLQTKVGSVFIDQPSVLPNSLGFVSMLGLVIECDTIKPTDCMYYTTDFGGGLRAYKSVNGSTTIPPKLVYAVGTTYMSGAATGGLAINNDAGVIYVVSATTPGAVLAYNKADGASLNINATGFIVQNDALQRPIGALYISTCTIIDFTVFYGTRSLGPISDAVVYYGAYNSSISFTASHDYCPGSVRPGSVKLTLDEPPISICDSTLPYTLELGKLLMPLGDRAVTATPYATTNCTGEEGYSLTKTVKVEGCDVTYNLYSGQTNKKITTIVGGRRYNPPCEVNIEADIKCGFKVKKVILEIHRGGKLVHRREDRRKPYFLYGSFWFNVYSGKLGVGRYSMFVTINGIVHPITTFNFGTCV